MGGGEIQRVNGTLIMVAGGDAPLGLSRFVSVMMLIMCVPCHVMSVLYVSFSRSPGRVNAFQNSMPEHSVRWLCLGTPS